MGHMSLLKRLGHPRNAVIGFFAVFVIGAICGLGIEYFWKQVFLCQGQYALLNPALQCVSGDRQGEWHYENLRAAVLQKKQELVDAGKITEMSVFFRDLNTGPRFGIGEYDAFQPASLLKLPILIAYLHEADRDPTILDKILSYDSKMKVNSNVEQSDETILPNTPYTVRDLLKKMIVFSDNYSYTLLTQELNSTPPITTYHTFHDLDVLPMMIAPNADFVSIQSYGNLFVVLYNAGYLSKQMSEFALELLSQATFKGGLIAGVPPRTQVSHKFGYRVLDSKHTQLHDCGIVYHPDTAYLLCVMTRGSDLQNEEYAIAEISSVVYNQISYLYYSPKN